MGVVCSGAGGTFATGGDCCLNIGDRGHLLMTRQCMIG